MNFISIVTDDQAAWSVGSYGNKESITPNMDRLAKEGARFANAFTITPVCSPSRATFMTGKLGTQLGITDWIAGNEDAAGVGLKPKETTWPEVLQAAGYQTALVGKWHLGASPEMQPTRQGFSHFYGFLGGGASPMNPKYNFPDGPKEVQGYGANLVTDEAIRWVGEVKAKPFVLCLHFREPHLAYSPVPEEDGAPFASLDPTVPESPGADVAQLKKWTREYYAAIHSVDRNLGRLFAFLEKEGLWDTTVIQFTSDHGYNIGHHGIHTKGNGNWIAGGVGGPKRPNMWDTSLRIPWLIRWPGVVKPGTVIEQMVTNEDVFKSTLGILGVAAPAGAENGGRDFSPLLKRENIPWREEVFGQYDLHNSGLAYMRMVRTDEWKYVRHFHANLVDELYDLKADPGETRNLMGGGKGAGKGKAKNKGKGSGQTENPAEVVEDLDARLQTWMISVNDPLLKEPRLKGWFEAGELEE